MMGNTSLTWLWWVVGGIVLVAVITSGLKGGGGGGPSRFIHVPDGENWRSVYRQKVINPQGAAPNPASKLVFGLGFGLVAVAVLIVWLDPF
jgi:hypothetical protein